MKLLLLGWLLFAPAAAAAAAAAEAAEAATLTVRVTNVRNAQGRVHVDLCAEPDFLTERCALSGEAAARTGTVTVIVRDVPPGRYAAQLFHDENGNGKVDRALFGIPKEGVGFSNDAPIRFGPPHFADAAFAMGREAQAIAVRLRYFTGASGPPGAR